MNAAFDNKKQAAKHTRVKGANGGSKYQKKHNKKQVGKVEKAAVAVSAPAFLYTSSCCGVAAIKPACLKDRDVRFEERKATLGTWLCTRCRRKAKVTRTKNVDGVIPGAAGASKAA